MRVQPDGLVLTWTPPWRFGWYDMQHVPDALYYTVEYNWTSLEPGDPRGEQGWDNQNQTRYENTDGPNSTQVFRFGHRAIKEYREYEFKVRRSALLWGFGSGARSFTRHRRPLRFASIPFTSRGRRSGRIGRRSAT